MHKKLPIFYTEKLTIKVDLRVFFMDETSEKNMQINFSSYKFSVEHIFSKFYEKVGVIFWLPTFPSHLKTLHSTLRF